MGNPNSIYCRWRRWDTGHMCRAYHPSACDRVSAVSAGVQFSGCHPSLARFTLARVSLTRASLARFTLARCQFGAFHFDAFPICVPNCTEVFSMPVWHYLVLRLC